jgi:murein DD-endopeptidase MepM/ murein hydrolase activator NlpD
MGRHRADAEPLARPVDPVTPYVGRRRAPALGETPAEPVETPSAYVGRRRAVAVEEPLPTPESVVDESVPTTAELRAIVDTPMETTAPRPRILEELADEPATPAVPAPRRSVETSRKVSLESIAPAAPVLTVALQATDTVVVPRVSIIPALEDTAIALPRITAASPETTSLTALGGRRRRAGVARGPLVKGLPPLPVVGGLAALAVAVAGVVATGHSPIAPAASHRLMQASALGGSSGTDSVGVRPAALSRDSDRSAAEQTADQRAEALSANDKQAGSYDAQLAKNQWGLPILAGDYHLTARFGDVSGLWRTVHTGLDFACPTGTPIHAVANGVITSTAWGGSYGNLTKETLPDGTELWYAHQSAYGSHVGEEVKEGEVIGYVGATGNVTGPHVHLEVRPGGGDPVDPDPALKAHGIDPDANQG